MVDGRVYVAAASAAVTSVMANSVRPHRRHTTRLPRPWDSPGKNTGVGCHFLLQCMKVKSESEVAQSCLTLRDSMDCSLPGFSTHGFSRQEYWSGVPLPSLIGIHIQTLFYPWAPEPICNIYANNQMYFMLMKSSIFFVS